MSRTRIVAISFAVVVAGCSQSPADEDFVLLPSSLAQVTTSIEEAFARDGQPQPIFVLAGSSRHVAQLADGAPASVLITADTETMQRAIDEGLVIEELGIVAENRLVLAVGPGNPAGIESINALADPDLLIGVCAPEVPCGRLAAEVADTLGLMIAADTEESNVLSLTNKIAQNELHAGLIYATDALAFGLETIDDDLLADFTTEYPAARVGPGSVAVVDFLLSDEGRVALSELGFSLP